MLLKSGKRDGWWRTRSLALSTLAIYLYHELAHQTFHTKVNEAINVLLASLKVWFSSPQNLLHWSGWVWSVVSLIFFPPYVACQCQNGLQCSHRITHFTNLKKKDIALNLHLLLIISESKFLMRWELCLLFAFYDTITDAEWLLAWTILNKLCMDGWVSEIEQCK